ncbi:phosphotransferase [Thermaerobacillus caldiproteolyticus]|uniref:Aminoglycoside phosphotransferase (APT) family kinase protein n=1 Tax=Thermaerobacillus caldiproteolyticus TaxID=247480 RepID=A0A7V9Z7K8_9BACL|nr:phosphotransferase [Anoxybacillus caldiproteolyticus]MBA2875537.1 aminoglycoside phosphotransferase (APT) family kinase protein [Anoxybacillus caldiproteolyticus]
MHPFTLHDIPNEIVDYVGTIKNIQFPRQGHTSDVGMIESQNGCYALKRTKGERFCFYLSQEVLVLNSISHTKLPVPKVHQFIEQKNEKQSWALFDYIEGETLRSSLWKENNEDKRLEMIFYFGKTLSEIHSTPCPRELVKNPLWLDEMLAQAEYNLQHYNVDGTAKLLNKLKTNRPKECQQTFIHGDFTIDNVLVRNGMIVGVIDWSGGAFGDPRYDVSLAIRPKRKAFDSELDVHIFFEGYGDKLINEEDYNYFANGLYEFF